MSTRLLLVESRMSMNGYFSRKSASRGSSQPTASVPTAPTMSGDSCHQSSQRGQFFGLHQIALCLTQVVESLG